MIAALAAALLALQTAARPMPFALEQFMDRSAALDGRWVEFDAFVVLMQRPGGPPTLAAVTSETHTLRNGATVTLCANSAETNLAVLLGRGGFGPLSRRPSEAYAGVRIRGILRGRPYSFRVGNFVHEWVGSVDHARIVGITGGSCSSYIPD